MPSVMYPRVTTNSNDLAGFIANLKQGAREMPSVNTRQAKTPAEITVHYDYSALAQGIEALRARYQTQIRTPQFFAGVSSSEESDGVSVTELLRQFREVYVVLEEKGITGATRAFSAAFPHFAHVSDVEETSAVSAVAQPVAKSAESTSRLDSIYAMESGVPAVEVEVASENVADKVSTVAKFEKASQAQEVSASPVVEEDPVAAFSRMRMGA